MVRIIANINPSIYKRIKELIDSGEYENIEQFIEIACDNQTRLDESEIQPSPTMHTKTPPPRATQTYMPGIFKAPKEEMDELEPERAAKPAHTAKAKKKRAGKAKKENVEPRIDKNEVMNALHLFRKSESVSLPSLLQPMEEHTKQWPWGQTNRYLPLKMIVRAVENQANGRSEWPDLNEAAGMIHQPSSVLGAALLILDREQNRKREQAISTALPRSEKEVGAKRFTNSFLGSITPTGIFYPGGAIYYGFISKTDNGKIGLTKSGYEFSRIMNPVLDGDIYQAGVALSVEEQNWLREYAMTLPGESGAFNTVYSALSGNELKPDDFAERIAEILGEADDGSFRIKFNGVVSRMVELGLIKRTWQGTNAFYRR